MARSQAILTTLLTPIFTLETFPASYATAANAWASAYKTYANDAISCALNAPTIGILDAKKV